MTTKLHSGSMDISTSSAVAFAQLPLRPELKRALQCMGFHAPSPIQLKALPLALFGSDVIGQAKSGTGKTAVFGLTAVEHVLDRLDKRAQLGAADQGVGHTPFALILAPTREIAMQIDTVLRQLADDTIHIGTFIGGLPMANDKRRLQAGCHIAVGTPGRVRWLIEDGYFLTRSVRLLVLDEVDKLLGGEFTEDINAIVAAVPERRQTLALSATFTPEQLVAVIRMMRDPQVVRVRGPQQVTVEHVLSSEDFLSSWIEQEKKNEPEVWLRHVHQFYRVVTSSTSAHGDPLNIRPKLIELASLLSEISFNQCIVFCNDKFRAEALATALENQGWPAAAITGAQPQTTRNHVMGQFRSLALRILISTDLTARGIDVDKVNFVINLDLPRDPATYLHRVGRTGRFGGKHGLAITLLTETEVEGIHLLSRVFQMAINKLPRPAPRDIRSYVSSEVRANQSAQALQSEDDSASESASETSAPTIEMQASPTHAQDIPAVPAPSVREDGGHHDRSAHSRAFAWEERCYDHWRSLLSDP